jgi:hypothetical protein
MSRNRRDGLWERLENKVRAAAEGMDRESEQRALRLFRWTMLGANQSVAIKWWWLVLLVALVPWFLLPMEPALASGSAAGIISAAVVAIWFIGYTVLRKLDRAAFNRLRQRHPTEWRRVFRVFQEEGMTET